jgi:hypothetical protein
MRVPVMMSTLLLAVGCSDPSTVMPAGNDGTQMPGGSNTGTTGDGSGMMMSTDPPDMAMKDPAGPWPVQDLTVYTLGTDIIDSSADDGQNIWAASRDTLYVFPAGDPNPKSFTTADGLHIVPFTDPEGYSVMSNITAIAAGHANEVFVGYYGYEGEGNRYEDTDAQKALGNGDRVTFDASTGKINVIRYAFKCDYDVGRGCWEDRSVRRAIYAHTGTAAGHAFFGFDHGVAHVFNDQIGDHVHPEIYWVNPDGTEDLKLGEHFGVAVDPNGNLWCAGRYGVGLQTWNPVPHFSWTSGPFIYAFTTYSDNHALEVPKGYTEQNSGAAVMPDGSVYLSSFTRGLTHWDPITKNYSTMTHVSSAPGTITDIAADPDGTLWIVDTDGNLSRLDPATNTLTGFSGVSAVHRVVVDTTVTPRAVYVSFAGGLAVIRAK